MYLFQHLFLWAKLFNTILLYFQEAKVQLFYSKGMCTAKHMLQVEKDHYYIIVSLHEDENPKTISPFK